MTLASHDADEVGSSESANATGRGEGIEAKIERYVRRYWSRHQEWPRVGRVARSLRLRQEEVQEASSALPLMLTSYFVHPPDPLRDHFVEICE